MPKHNIDTLTDDVQKLRNSYQTHKKDVIKRLDTMQPQVQEMHEYIIEQRGYERGASKARKSEGVNISSDIIKLLLLLAGIIAALVGAERIVG